MCLCYRRRSGEHVLRGAHNIGLVTLSELVEHVRAISDSVEIPLLVDGDTGFGNSLNARRTVKVLERAGATGMQIEDQVFRRNVGTSPGKRSSRFVIWFRK